MLCAAAAGFMGYLGLSLNYLCIFIPFLTLGIGLDDVFVILEYFKSIPEMNSKDTVELTKRSLHRSGAAIWTTTLTDMIAFLVGAVTSIGTCDGFINFCCCMVTSLLFDYILQITLFVALVKLVRAIVFFSFLRAETIIFRTMSSISIPVYILVFPSRPTK